MLACLLANKINPNHQECWRLFSDYFRSFPALDCTFIGVKLAIYFQSAKYNFSNTVIGDLILSLLSVILYNTVTREENTMFRTTFFRHQPRRGRRSWVEWVLATSKGLSCHTKRILPLHVDALFTSWCKQFYICKSLRVTTQDTIKRQCPDLLRSGHCI